MILLTDEQWDTLFDKVDETIQKAISDLPPKIQDAANDIICLIDKYTSDANRRILGCYILPTSGPIIIYAGQIYEDCGLDIDKAMESVRQVYYHELAHAIGDLTEGEVEERGL